MHAHLDALGGVSGDMFLASLLDAHPDLVEPLISLLNTLPLTVIPPISVTNDNENHGLRGLRFSVGEVPAQGHEHTPWAEIRQWLRGSSLPQDVMHHAVGIFEVLAKAEATVHGVDEDQVAFHEVGAVDSIIDIVGAAFLIDALHIERWSVSSLPLGSGRISSAHGVLPVPAPAAALLMRGFLTHDDGIPGERVTPTGAAILCWLECTQEPYRSPRRLLRSGVGLGARSIPGISNCLRVLCFDPRQGTAMHRELAIIEFEVDDQTPEDLAIGLERLRTQPGVLDVLQMSAFGKKGRIGVHIQLIAAPEEIESVSAACFCETTTIGLRYRIEQAMALPRRISKVAVGDRLIRAKVVERPSTRRTAKADIEDVAESGGHAVRTLIRQQAEDSALGCDQESPIE